MSQLLYAVDSSTLYELSHDTFNIGALGCYLLFHLLYLLTLMNISSRLPKFSQTYHYVDFIFSWVNIKETINGE